jgi:hypothetical protein
VTEPQLRLALDQNLPTPLITAVRPYLPPEIELTHVHKLDARLSDLTDRELLIALSQLGYDGLVTNNYRMLGLPEEIAAIVATNAVVVAVEGLGHDPLRAVGVLLLELPGLADRVVPGRSSVFFLSYRRRQPSDAWEYMQQAAARRHRDVAELWDEVKVSHEELSLPVLKPEA